ncbi:MAG: anaerobic ribonucleoside-triphosphate reductase activating protein, partial [Dehalococcoidia bacterium]|nr:anaerobic ribonucleoside-triphosphate reductase activating protein [Dehalococcoidia bacterium]
MVFGGLQKTSLIDFPKKISSVLFVSGCNFDCPYCHNPQLVNGGPEAACLTDEKNVFDFLARRREYLNGVVISGGEPTLQKDLAALCEKIKRMGYAIKLDTNGSRPDVIESLIRQGLVDYIAMDIKTDPFSYAPLIRKQHNPEDILASISIIMASALDYEFRTTCVKPLVDVSIIIRISRFIQDAKLYALQQFHNTRVLHPEYYDENTNIYTNDEITA